MNSLAKFTIDAHGGLTRWEQFKEVSADLVQGGVLWEVKGKAGILDKTNVTVGLRSEWASHSPFGTAGRRSRFEPEQVAIPAPRAPTPARPRAHSGSFAGHCWR